MIPLTLLYASLLPLSLHLVLLIWSPHSHEPDSTGESFLYIPPMLAQSLKHFLGRLDSMAPMLNSIRDAIRREKIDEMWIATHLLSGMSSGLALRVLLPTKPWQTMVAVLGGWLARAVVELVMLYLEPVLR